MMIFTHCGHLSTKYQTNKFFLVFLCQSVDFPFNANGKSIDAHVAILKKYLTNSVHSSLKHVQMRIWFLGSMYQLETYFDGVDWSVQYFWPFDNTCFSGSCAWFSLASQRHETQGSEEMLEILYKIYHGQTSVWTVVISL